MTENITIEYEQTMEDFIAFSEFVRNDISSFRKTRDKILKVLSAAIIITNIILVARFHILLETYNVVFSMILFLYFFVFKTNWFFAYWIKRRYSKSGYAAFFGKRKLFLNEDVLLTKSDTVESKFTWNSFIYFKESKHYFFIFLTKNQAVIIPKRIFLLPQEEYDMKSFIERKLAEQKINS